MEMIEILRKVEINWRHSWWWQGLCTVWIRRAGKKLDPDTRIRNARTRCPQM